MIRNKKIKWIGFFLCASLWGAPYTDNGSGTITDSATGLVWQKCSAGLGTTLGNCNTGSDSMYSWSNAITYCEGITLGGRSDWRLPNVNELRSIADYGKSSPPTIDIIAFPNTRKLGYWSSSKYARFTVLVWFVNFSNGSVDFDGDLGSKYVRCVAGP